jgi:thiol:disulfide interchange protein DsbD
MILIALTVFLGIKSYQAIQMHSCPISNSLWITQYACAREKALDEKKLLFIDIGAPFCSICKALDNTLFKDAHVLEALKDVVAVKLDGSLDENSALMQQHKVIGFPTLLLVDPKEEIVIKKWGPELYGADPQIFVDELKALIAAF